MNKKAITGFYSSKILICFFFWCVLSKWNGAMLSSAVEKLKRVNVILVNGFFMGGIQEQLQLVFPRLKIRSN